MVHLNQMREISLSVAIQMEETQQIIHLPQALQTPLAILALVALCIRAVLLLAGRSLIPVR